MRSTMLKRGWAWITLALPVVAGLAPGAEAARMSQATNVAIGESAAPPVVVKEIGGTLFFSERGGPFMPVPDGPRADCLRELLRGPEAAPVVAVDVGRTIVADGGNGWHSSKP